MSGFNKRIQGDALARRAYRMSIEPDFVEHVNRAAAKKHIPVSDTRQQ